MPDISTHLLLPYLVASQAQKQVTYNEALRQFDGLRVTPLSCKATSALPTATSPPTIPPSGAARSGNR
jgi:hypothetical protein